MRDESRRKYDNDVFYEVWRRGGNTDCIDYDRVSDSFWMGRTANGAASVEMEIQHERRRQRETECEEVPDEISEVPDER